ncbi:alanine racemase [Micromonospora sp. SL4-19]|uniref:alanine racemase n=1 Tax=Micromonospora sp. SL4-19 TaxID=3399129 RepID=UPI003A4DF73F
MSAPGEAVVDLGAIAANLRTIAAMARTPLMAVVKADGFGHCAVPVARAAVAAGATWLGTTSAAEALELRDAGLTTPILSWLHPVDEDFGRLIDTRVDISVSSLPHLHAVAAAARLRGTPAFVQLKADTGLSRNGAIGSDWPELTAWARKYEKDDGVRVRGVWSHLANADAHDDTAVAAQVDAFEEAVQAARATGLDPRLLHLANSAAALHAPRTRFDLCRIGIALYGFGPGLRPAMTLGSRVVNVKRVPAGTGISYGPDHVTARPTTLALLPLGFADGLPRAAQGRAEVWLHGQRRPIAGRIAMDQCVIDAGDLPVRIGDPVTVFGDEPAPTAADWARWAGTNPHEILTGIGARVGRILGKAANP